MIVDDDIGWDVVVVVVVCWRLDEHEDRVVRVMEVADQLEVGRKHPHRCRRSQEDREVNLAVVFVTAVVNTGDVAGVGVAVVVDSDNHHCLLSTPEKREGAVPLFDFVL